MNKKDSCALAIFFMLLVLAILPFRTALGPEAVRADAEAGARAAAPNKPAASEALAPDQADSAYNDDVRKSWTIETQPEEQGQSFLNRLSWKDYQLGDDYVLRTGVIYGKWIAAMQFVKNGKLVLTEYTPPSEYIVAIDPVTGRPADTFKTIDANHDHVMEMAFLHEKLDDPKYHMYTVYQLQKSGPKLVWKSAGKLGDWVRGEAETANVKWEFDSNSVLKH